MTTRARIVRVVQIACFAVIAVDAFFPYVVSQLPSWGWLVPGTAWVAGLAEMHRTQVRGGRVALWIFIPVLLACASYVVTTLPDVVLAPLGSLPATLNQYLFVFPVLLVAGVICARSPHLGALIGSIRIVGVLSALMALFERFSGHLVFPGNQVTTNFGASGHRAVAVLVNGSGSVRGIVGSYHPLVLGTLLAVVVALAVMRPGRAKLVEVPVLMAGIYATDSIGPFGIGALMIALAVVRGIRARAGAAPIRVGAVVGVCAAAIVVFLGFATWVWQPVVDANSTVDVSTQYRFALFSMIPRLLALNPLGLGIGDLPVGSFLIDSTGHPIDIAVSVDSELVVLVLQLGVIGLAAYFGILLLAVRNVVRAAGSVVGSWGLLAFTLCGFTVALHVWFTDASLWCFFIGVGLAALRRAPGFEDPAAPAPATERLPIVAGTPA